MWILFLYLFVVAVMYEIALVIYRLTLHPLAHSAGSKLTAATQWWETYLDIVKGEGGGFMYEVYRMREEYGMILIS